MSNKVTKGPRARHNAPVASYKLEKTETSVSFSPVPPAQELERLEMVQPGITERILTMAEKEQAERHANNHRIIDLEKQNIRNINLNARLGLFLGFGSVLVTVSLCGFFGYLGDTAAAAKTAAWVITSLAAVFITGRVAMNKKKESE